MNKVYFLKPSGNKAIGPTSIKFNHSPNVLHAVLPARSGLKAVVALMPLLGLTWLFGFLSVDGDNTLIFTYLFTICNSLQVRRQMGHPIETLR